MVKADNGFEFGEPIAAVYKDEARCYDPCIWIDPLDRLWFIWACAPNHAVYAVICDDPDADELVWSDVIKIGKDVMMNKPTVLTTGEWLFPIAVWNFGVRTGGFHSEDEDSDRKTFAYKSVDNGKTFKKLGGSDIEKRSYDEHMILELKDGSLAMFVRTTYGIGVSHSFDRGKTWTKGEDSGIAGPCSRFFIRRLKSGRVLLINHYNFDGRNNLTALLSEDECKTWKYKLLLDERSDISYPDAVESDDGYIYITYDRERGTFRNCISDVYAMAREILVCKITEDDIINGKVTDPGSKLKVVASKLGKYVLEDENPFAEIKNYSEDELTKLLLDQTNEQILNTLFDTYQINCINVNKIDNGKLDSLIESLNDNKADRNKTIHEIISLIRSVTTFSKEDFPIVERIKSILQEDLASDISVNALAKKLGISLYYMCHLFKKITGVTIVDYKNELKLTKAKEYLVNTDKKISEIAQECGFGSDSYFSKLFTSAEQISPTQYRKLLRNNNK